MFPFDRILVAGAGLIGGSVALAARRGGFDRPVVAFEPDRTRLREARATGAFDRVHGRPIRPEDVRSGDLVVLAAPARAVDAIVRQLGRLDGRDAIVTDCASTKRTVVAAAAGAGSRFVGGHPMAGSEHAGAAHARADLFEGAPWILTGGDAAALSRVARFVRLLGAHPVRVDPGLHDRHAARISHVPQLAACALARVAARGGEPPFPAGPGLASMTRLASSPWSVWRDVLATNADAIVPVLDELIAELAGVRDALARGDSGALDDAFAASPATSGRRTPCSPETRRARTARTGAA